MKKIILSLLVAMILIPIVSAIPQFTMQSVGTEAGNVYATQNPTSFDVLICPNDWSEFYFNLTHGADVLVANQELSDTSSSCVAFNTLTTFGVTLSESESYTLSAVGFHDKTNTQNGVWNTLTYTPDADYYCADNDLTCTGKVCRVTKSNCDANMENVMIRIYTVHGNLLSEYQEMSWLISDTKTFILPEYNIPYVVAIISNDATHSHASYQYELIEDAQDCLNPSFVVGVAEGSTQANVTISGFTGEYTSFSWDLYKNNYGNYQKVQSGEDTSREIFLSPLIPSSSYKMVITGENPCGTGYTHYREFTTADVVVDEAWALSFTTTGSNVTVTVTPDVSSDYTYKLYYLNSGISIETTDSTSDSYTFENLTDGVPYLVAVDSHQGAEIVSKSIIVETNTSGDYYLGITTPSSSQFASIIFARFRLNNGTASTFPIGTLQLNTTVDNGVDSHTKTTSFEGGYDETYFIFTELTPNTTYNVTSTLTTESGWEYVNDTESFTTQEYDTDIGYHVDLGITADSRFYFEAGERYDVDAYVSVEPADSVTGNYYADSLTYQLYDNSTGVPLLIIDNTNTTGNFLVENILPDYRYFVHLQNVTFDGYVFNDSNRTLIASTNDKFVCDGRNYIKQFDFDIKLDANDVQFLPILYDNIDSYVDTGFGCSWYVEVRTPILQEYANGSYYHEVVSSKEITRTNPNEYTEIGAYSDAYDLVNVYIKRTCACAEAGGILGRTYTGFTEEREVSVSTSDNTVETYGVLQSGYDFFDDYFPTKLGKFAVVMTASVLLGLGVWLSMSLNGISTGWAVGLIPVVLGLILLYVFNSIPASILVTIGLVALVVLFVKMASAFTGGA